MQLYYPFGLTSEAYIWHKAPFGVFPSDFRVFTQTAGGAFRWDACWELFAVCESSALVFSTFCLFFYPSTAAITNTNSAFSLPEFQLCSSWGPAPPQIRFYFSQIIIATCYLLPACKLQLCSSFCVADVLETQITLKLCCGTAGLSVISANIFRATMETVLPQNSALFALRIQNASRYLKPLPSTWFQ